MKTTLSLLALVLCVGCSANVGPGPDPSNDPTNPSSPSNPNNPPESCGVNPIETHGEVASVAADGTVTFKPIPVGSSVMFSIPIRESADTDETIVGGRTNNSAFKVLAAFPIYVPKGETVNVLVSFSPSELGETSADMGLDTAKMGTSHAKLVGTGL